MPSFEKNISKQKLTESMYYKDAESFEINYKLGESTFINLLLHFIFAYLITGVHFSKDSVTFWARVIVLKSKSIE